MSCRLRGALPDAKYARWSRGCQDEDAGAWIGNRPPAPPSANRATSRIVRAAARKGIRRGNRLRQTAERARVKARIKALTDRTVARGCTEAEAMAAADMVGRLLERYALSMDEIEVREARCVQAEVPLGGRRRRPIDGCVPAIARFCDCKVWLARAARPDPGAAESDSTPSGSRYVFFGFESDTALATYLFAVVDRAIATGTTAFRQANPQLRAVRLRRASASFQHGMAARIAARLEAMHRAREEAVQARRTTGTALILAKHRVVEDALREADVRLVSAPALGRRPVAAAFRDGWAAGERVNLNRPVPGSAVGLLR